MRLRRPISDRNRGPDDHRPGSRRRMTCPSVQQGQYRDSPVSREVTVGSVSGAQSETVSTTPTLTSAYSRTDVHSREISPVPLSDTLGGGGTSSQELQSRSHPRNFLLSSYRGDGGTDPSCVRKVTRVRSVPFTRKAWRFGDLLAGHPARNHITLPDCRISSPIVPASPLRYLRRSRRGRSVVRR